MTTTLHIDQLKEFHLRDLSRLEPGTEVIFGHVPPLTDPSLLDFHETAQAMRGTVTRLGDSQELYKSADSELEREIHPVIFFTRDHSREDRRFAADAGVIPYSVNSTGYNTTNFTVLAEDLEAAGVMLNMTPSAEYLERLAKFNSEVVVADYLDDYFSDDC